MAMIRPTLILDMDLDKRSYTDDMAADLRRAYTHVAASKVISHEAGEGLPEDILRMNVKLNKPYWDASVEGAEEQWRGVMPKWLRNMFYKISSNMLAFNRMREERGENALEFAWLELNFLDNVVVAIHLNADSSIPADAQAWVESARELFNEGAFGSDVARISIPSAASYAAQAAEHTVLREVVGEPEDAEAASAEGAANVAEDAPAGPTVRTITELEPFEIDFSAWGIVRADGVVEEYHA